MRYIKETEQNWRFEFQCYIIIRVNYVPYLIFLNIFCDVVEGIFYEISKMKH